MRSLWKREVLTRFCLSLLALVVFLWMAVTSSIRGQILGVVLLALVLWSLFPKRHFVTSVIIIVLLSLFQASLSVDEFIGSVFSAYGGSGLWIIISGFVLSSAMEASGLARRTALWVVTALGGDPDKVVLSIALANLAIAPLSPSTTAKAFMLLPICVSLVQAFNAEKGRSRYGAGVLIMSMAANNICSTGFLTATVPNPISAEYIKSSSGIDLSWFDWLRMALPLTLVLLAASWLTCRWMFRPEVGKSSEALERVRNLRLEMGPLCQGERLVALVFSAALVLWITEGLHGLNSGLISLGLSLVLLLPRIGVVRIGGFAKSVPWGSIALFAASLFLGRAVGQYRALDPVASSLFDLLNLSRFQLVFFIALMVAVSMFLHVVFTSTTVYATVVVPLSISIAGLQGAQPQLAAIPVAFLAPIALILPVNTIPNIVFYSTGYFSQRQMLAYGTVTSLVSVVLILLIGLPYWKLLGLIQF